MNKIKADIVLFGMNGIGLSHKQYVRVQSVEMLPLLCTYLKSKTPC